MNLQNKYQKRRICRFVTISLFSGLFFFFPVYEISAQPQNSRPAVGLALSGGGSLGMAHVGVLKVMEEAGLRPDYISGVSMGSIIGSMYALGYSADSIHKILKQTRWDDLDRKSVV